jgi:hypothetical protein
MAWTSWIAVWDALNTSPAREQDYSAWARECEDAIAIFITRWVGACGSTKGVYLHILQAHIGDLVRVYGNLHVLASQGAEHGHKMRKQVPTNNQSAHRSTTHLDHIIVKKFLAEALDSTEFAQEFERAKTARMKQLLRKAKQFGKKQEEYKTDGWAPTAHMGRIG